MIKTIWPSTTANDRKVARDLLSHNALVGIQTLAAVAENAGISARSIIRCAKKPGFVSYPKYQKFFYRGIDK
ncbi:MAG: hypothetical protein OEM85_15950 [Gammaproteobacteria bacterium]|nr:hypothetical protein [Gammaproteobacteria bacterium]MDH3374858.1 hypothetical protein [Gammaproteobacteria bacterium]MDH3408353.1 hypothetical protein [Gammaproteobacteria bacterium]